MSRLSTFVVIVLLVCVFVIVILLFGPKCTPTTEILRIGSVLITGCAP